MRIGCAGWNVPKQHMALFPAAGSHLHRYAQRFNAVEINSSFYRPHRRATYERWAATVPDDFAFAAKLPKQITHELRLAAAESALDIFLDQVRGLRRKTRAALGPAAAKSGIRFRCGARVLCRATGAPWGRRGLRAAACDLVHRRSRRTAGGPPNCTRRRGSTGRHCAFRAGRLARAALLSPARCAAHLLLRLRRRVRGAPCPDILGAIGGMLVHLRQYGPRSGDHECGVVATALGEASNLGRQGAPPLAAKEAVFHLGSYANRPLPAREER